MLIGVDLDDVLADHMSALVAFHNKTYGTSLIAEDFRTFRLWETWGGTRAEAVRKVHDFYATDDFRRTQPVPGAIEGIETLRRAHELTVITGRTESVAEPTREWIDRHFLGKFSGVHFTNHYALNGRPEQSKAAVCTALGAQVLIEDALDHVPACLQCGIRVLLFDRPWNRSGVPPATEQHVTRVSSWPEVVATVDALTRF